MAGFAEYDQYDGLGLAELIREKKVSPFELCEEAIKRIEKINPVINAVVTPMFDIGREVARKSFFTPLQAKVALCLTLRSRVFLFF